jgi:hypothetical protein
MENKKCKMHGSGGSQTNQNGLWNGFISCTTIYASINTKGICTDLVTILRMHLLKGLQALFSLHVSLKIMPIPQDASESRCITFAVNSLLVAFVSLHTCFFLSFYSYRAKQGCGLTRGARRRTFRIDEYGF